MRGDGTIRSTIASWWGKVRPQGARRDGAPASDAMFIDVMADFSRKLGERAARQMAGGLATAQQERREALRAYDHARRRQQMLTAGVAVGALIALGIASLAPPIAPPVSAPPTVAAPTAPPPPVMVAAAQPTVIPDTAPSAPAPTPAPAPVPAPVTAMASPAPEPLRVDEVREIQKRLYGFGFSPGPADGVAGRLTANAVMNYQQNRGQPQTGEIDRDLLLQLREDPAPQVTPPPQRAAQRVARRSSNPFDQFGRWLDSVFR